MLKPKPIHINHNLSINLFLSLGSVIFFRFISLTTGKITAFGGLGYDGVTYATMITDGLSSGGVNKQLRPFLILLTRIPYYLTHDIIQSFEIMNYIYVFIFGLSLCLIFDTYNNNVCLKTFYLVNILSCIAATKVFAFYPTLIDLGCYAVINLALYLIISQKRILSSIVCVLAVLSREFAIAVPILGICRDVRTNSLNKKTILTYLPSLVVFIALRVWVKLTNVNPIGTQPLISVFDLIGNGVKFLCEPVFVAFLLYFTLTIWGGISMILASQFSFCMKCLREEYEYAIFLGLVIGVSALGDADLWRYLAYSIPVVTVIFARYSRHLKIGESYKILLVSALGTILTQQPFVSMNMEKYFGYWFPLYWFYYGEPLKNQGISRPVNLELVWISLFAIAFLGVWLLAKLHRQNHQESV